MGTRTVSAKIPEELKEELDEADINISEAIREALEAEVHRQRRSAIRKRVDDLESSISSDEIAAVVRSDRDKR